MSLLTSKKNMKILSSLLASLASAVVLTRHGDDIVVQVLINGEEYDLHYSYEDFVKLQ